MHYYKFNIGDYASHTQHLDPIEDIAYRRMLDWVYLHESPLPDCIEQIGRLIRMRTHSESIAIVLREFFTKTDYGWMQEKASVEIDSYKEKSDKAKASAAARWAKKPNKPDANALPADSERNANQEPLTINQEPLTINQYKDVLAHLKMVTGRAFRESTDLKARLKTFSIDEIKLVIDYKAKDWMGSDMQKYLRPQTLFNKSKFESYLNDAQQMVPTDKQPNNKLNQTIGALQNIELKQNKGLLTNGQPKQI